MENNQKTQCNKSKICSVYVKGISLIMALVLSALILRDGVLSFKKNHDFISVKGLAEKVVIADFAIWVIPVNLNGDNLDIVRAKVDEDVDKIIAYLKKYNITDDEIEIGTARVYDKMAQKYYNDNNKAKRFSIDQSIVVKSPNVDFVKKASQSVNELLKEGVVLAYDGYNSTYAPQYLFTKLNEIKPVMLSDAMKEAHKAAEQLLTPEGKNVGAIKHASQGMFSIYSREAVGSGANIDQRAYGAAGNRYSMDEAYFMEKVVRVVASVDYYVN